MTYYVILRAVYSAYSCYIHLSTVTRWVWSILPPTSGNHSVLITSREYSAFCHNTAAFGVSCVKVTEARAYCQLQNVAMGVQCLAIYGSWGMTCAMSAVAELLVSFTSYIALTETSFERWEIFRGRLSDVMRIRLMGLMSRDDCTESVGGTMCEVWLAGIQSWVDGHIAEEVLGCCGHRHSDAEEDISEQVWWRLCMRERICLAWWWRSAHVHIA